MSIYLGKRHSDAQWEPFRPDGEPTDVTHGHRYSVSEGPFDDIRDALLALENLRK